MKENSILVDDLVIGIVYRYYTDDGRSYVGCTINEKKRRYAWNCKKNPYGGNKIADARKSLGLTAFKYERLYIVLADSKNGLTKRLENLEAMFIRLFDSFDHGFNTSQFGRGNKGRHLSPQHKELIGKGNCKGVYMIASDGVKTLMKSLCEVAQKLKVAVSTVYRHLNTLSTTAIKGYTLQYA